MKFIKSLGAFLYSTIACYLIYRGLLVFMPWFNELSWYWYLLVLFFANSLIYLVLFPISTPLVLLTKNNMGAAVLVILTALYYAYKCVCVPWANGVSDFGVLEWIGSIIITLNILRLYKELVFTMFMVINGSNENRD